MRKLLTQVWAVALSLFAVCAPSYAQNGFFPFDTIDPANMTLVSTTPLNGEFDYQVWDHPVRPAGANKYVRPDAPAFACDNADLGSLRVGDASMRAITNSTDCVAAGEVWAPMPWKTGLIVPHTPPNNNTYKLESFFDGYGADPYPNAPTWDESVPGYITVKNTSGHYPHLNFYTGFDWGGFVKGDANHWRYGAGFGKAQQLMSGSIDWLAGIRLRGTSWGGTTVILQSFLMKDPLAQAMITIVQPHIANTLMVRQDTTPGDGINQYGMYYRDAAIASVWNGPNDVANSDIITSSDKVKGVYYSVTGNAYDTAVVFDKDFFPLLCNAKKIACMGAWIGMGHGQGDVGVVINPEDRSTAIGLPFMSRAPKGPFSGPDSDVRMNKILPVFTDSTANFFSSVPDAPGYARGHWNLGLEWNSTTQPATTTTSLVLPIRYRQHTGFGTGQNASSGLEEPNSALWIPDQPTSAGFTLTLRRAGNFTLPLGKVINYSLPAHGSRSAQTGTATVTVAGEVTIPGLVMDTGLAYKNLTITPAVVAPQWDIVFSRAPYAGNPIVDVDAPADSEQATYQHTADVTTPWSNIIQSDVVLKNTTTGAERVLFNCTTSGVNCAAQEARVSPDGSKIAFSVTFGPSSGPYIQGAYAPDVPMVAAVCAQIYIHDIAANTTTPVGNRPGAGTSCQANYDGANAPLEMDRSPDWASNTKLVFSSSRANKYPIRSQLPQHIGHCGAAGDCVSQAFGGGHTGKSAQIWTMNSDGSNPVLLTPHDNMALTPNVQTNGDIVYSCLTDYGEKAGDGATNIPVAGTNKYWLCRMDSNGADMTILAHGHATAFRSTSRMPGLPSPRLKDGYSDEFRALRAFAEIFPGKMAGPNYYRANHTGSYGALYGFEIGDPHVEGCLTEAGCMPDGGKSGIPPGSAVPGSANFLNPTWKTITPWGQSTDAYTNFIETVAGSGVYNRATGKAGYAAPWSSTQMMYTWAQGNCYAPSGMDGFARSFTMGPTCRKSIYQTTPGPANTFPMITNPYDTAQQVPLVDDPTKNFWDSRRVATYQTIFGQTAPDVKPALVGTACYLQVANGRAGEIFPVNYPIFTTATSAKRCQSQGCGVFPLSDPVWMAANMEFVNVRIVEPFTFGYASGTHNLFRETMNTVGHKGIRPYLRSRLRADGSVKIRVPCNTPLVLSGENKQGETIAHDDLVMSLRPGEKRTCHGCHEGHSVERTAQYAAVGIPDANTHFSLKSAASLGSLPLGSVTRPSVKWAQIQPILTRTCGSCHNRNSGGAQTNPYGFDHKGFHLDSVAYPGQFNPIYPAGDNPLLFYSRIVMDAEQNDMPWLPKRTRPSNPGDDKLYIVPKPCSSQLVCKFAVESPLYWYATGQRKDYRLNTTVPTDTVSGGNDDPDYKVGHPPSGFTASEKALLREFIDSGSQYQ